MKTRIFSMMMTGLFLCAPYSSSWGSGSNLKHEVVSNGHIKTQEYQVSPFTGIHLGVPADVTCTHSQDTRVEITVSDNLLPLLEVKVKDGALSISFKEDVRSVNNRHRFDIRLSAPSVKDYYVTGSGHIRITDRTDTEGSVRTSITGSGSIEGGDISCSGFSGTVTGSGSISLRDIRSGNATVCLTGSGNFTCADMQAEDLRSDITGSGVATLRRVSAPNVAVSMSGSGNLSLHGLTSEHVSTRQSGSGAILIEGSGVKARFEIVGSGNVNAVGLQTENVEASIVGPGTISCHATKSLKSEVTGSGKVSYKGDPQRIEVPGLQRIE